MASGAIEWVHYRDTNCIPWGPVANSACADECTGPRTVRTIDECKAWCVASKGCTAISYRGYKNCTDNPKWFGKFFMKHFSLLLSISLISLSVS